MSTRGIGSKLMSAFGTIFIGRQDVEDTDDAEVAVWEDWFFDAPDEPPPASAQHNMTMMGVGA